MKSMRLIIATLGMAALFALSTTAYADVAGGLHDMGVNVAGLTINYACEPCHAPHNNTTAAVAAGAPIWNRDQTSVPAITGYPATATFDGGPASLSTGDLLCMNCHEGTIGMDAYGGAAGTAAKNLNTLDATKALGTNLSDSHPVGFSYNASLAGPGESVGVTLETVVNVEAAGFTLFGATEDVACGTCHDPHLTNGLATNNKFLVGPSLATTFCQTCHLDK